MHIIFILKQVCAVQYALRLTIWVFPASLIKHLLVVTVNDSFEHGFGWHLETALATISH